MSIVLTLEQLHAIQKDATRCLRELEEEERKQEKAAWKAVRRARRAAEKAVAAAEAEESERTEPALEGFERREDCFLCRKAEADCFWPIRCVVI